MVGWRCTMTPVKIGNATLYNADCRDVIPSLGRVGAVVTDPPYGLKESQGKNKSRDGLAKATDYGSKAWDNEPCSKAEIDLMRGHSDWQIIFGGNYFEVPPSSCWLVWDKNNTGDFADAELAWTNLPGAVRLIQWTWNGMIRKGTDERVHPTQKPLGVMLWCLERLPDAVETVLDPYMGSGTTGVACKRAGKAFIGVERDPEYFDLACARLEKENMQTELFDA